jgi:hypothetical protein
MPSKKRQGLEKKLSYRLEIPPGSEDAVLASVASHWDGFTWVCGRHIVEWIREGVGRIQVWAVDEQEGRGVIEHALSHMGIEPEDWEFYYSVCKSPRFGRVATVRATIASLRSGPQGATPHTYLLGQWS